MKRIALLSMLVLTSCGADLQLKRPEDPIIVEHRVSFEGIYEYMFDLCVDVAKNNETQEECAARLTAKLIEAL